ncbi:hypothetical protein HWV62_15925 [Athelia sp. TMB]|nr:hypothetical protein HWV62_15925 [Athelia sp. TMB]
MPVPKPADTANEKVPQSVFHTIGNSGNVAVYNVAGDWQGNEELASRIAQTLILHQLPYAKGASWDETLTCLSGTRASVLSVIDTWAHLRDSRNIFWLNGVAGSGKSAIAHTVARSLCEAGFLTAAFFFSRDIASRNNPNSLFSTIARDIANLHDGIAEQISGALEKEPALASASLSRQFDAFILKPSSHHSINRPIVIVIDALDESIQNDHNTSLLVVLRDEAKKLPPHFRILITSRPTTEIDRFFSREAHIISYPLDIYSSENKQDIVKYVNSQLCSDMIRSSVGPDWPGEDAIRELERLSGGLFIWIATICVYLRTVYHPRKKLRALLSKSPQESFTIDKKMDSLYTTVLAACGEWDDKDFLEDYNIVMGTIMAAKRPLSLTVLRALHESVQELSPEDLLTRFGSVLVSFREPNQPIRILHLSFREFITDRAANDEGTRKFYISETKHSSRLAQTCLQFLNEELRNTGGVISGMGYLSGSSEDLPGIPEIQGVSEKTMYCCEHWIDHLVDVEEPISVSQDIGTFVSKHLTMWLEIVTSKSTFHGSLASVLSSLADRLSHARRLDEALLATQESVFLRRALVAKQPEKSELSLELAASLGVLSLRFLDLGLHVEAQAASNEASSISSLSLDQKNTSTAGVEHQNTTMQSCIPGDIHQQNPSRTTREHSQTDLSTPAPSAHAHTAVSVSLLNQCPTPTSYSAGFRDHHESASYQDQYSTPPVDTEFSSNVHGYPDQDKDTPFLTIVEDLRNRIIDGRGPLCPVLVPSGCTTCFASAFYVYLFKEALIYVVEVRKQSFGRLLSNASDKEEDDAPVVVQGKGLFRLKGRMYIRHIKQVTATSSAGDMSLTIDMDMEDEKLDSFALIFSEKEMLESWRQEIESLVNMFHEQKPKTQESHVPPQSRSFRSPSWGSALQSDSETRPTGSISPSPLG